MLKSIGKSLLSGLAMLALANAAEAADTEVTLVQGHAKLGVGEDIFIYVVPQTLGWFEAEGIRVNLEGVRGSTLAAQILQSGDAQFATTAPEVVMSVREKGGEVKIFMAVRRQGGYEWAVRADSDIQAPEDFKGRTIGAASLASGAVPILKGAMQDIGLGETEYSVVATGTGGQAATALSTGNIDVLALWDIMHTVIENSGVALRRIQIPVIPKLAGFALASTDTYIAENPDVVAGMCRATAKAVVFVNENPEAAVRMLYELSPETAPNPMTDEALARDVAILKTYMTNATGSDAGVPLGWNYPEKWQFSYDYYTGNGRVTEPKPLGDHYTNDFIERCNDFDAEAVRELARSR